MFVNEPHDRRRVGSVKSVQGAVSGPSTGPFPWTASRTRRATFIATGAPQALRWFMFACRQVACGQGGGGRSPVAVACGADLLRVEQFPVLAFRPPSAAAVAVA